MMDIMRNQNWFLLLMCFVWFYTCKVCSEMENGKEEKFFRTVRTTKRKTAMTPSISTASGPLTTPCYSLFIPLFTCENNQCVNIYFRCDGFADCADRSDEKNCDTTTSRSTSRSSATLSRTSSTLTSSSTSGPFNPSRCTSDQFTCNNRKCIPLTYKCDRDDDCGDNSDELNCNCTTSQFTCNNSLCIPLYYKCDAINHCGDYSDEKNCSCRSNQFTCNNLKCISLIYKCDRDNDCGDNSDELNCGTTTSSNTVRSTASSSRTSSSLTFSPS